MFNLAGPSSSHKKAHSGKSSLSQLSPIQVSSSLEGRPAPSSPSVSPAPPRGKKHVENFNQVRKKLYFSSKAVLRSRVLYPEVSTYLVVAQLCNKLAS